MSHPRWDREGRYWPHRDASRFVDAAGLRWHVQTMGRGPVALLLHGTGAATHSWRGLAPLLRARFTVIAPDLPGHGFTSPPRAEGYTMPAMARGIAALLDTLDARPALIIGHSAGAAIACRLALDGRTSAPIASINGALLPFPGAGRMLFPTLAKALVLNPFVPRLATLTMQSRRGVARFLARATGSRIDAEGGRLYQALFAHSGHCAAALAMMAQWDLPALERDLPDLANPVLLLAASGDAAIPDNVARRLAAMVRNARRVALDGLGHLAHEEAPERVADAIFAFADAHGINEDRA